MTTVTEINASPRSQTGKGITGKLRRQGFIPAVCYARGSESISLTVGLDELIKHIDPDRGRNTLFTLKIEGSGDRRAIIRDFQYHPVSRKLLHVDFLEVSDGREITTTIPVRYVGKEAVEKRGARLFALKDRIAVRCTADRIPPGITVDIAEYEIGRLLRVAELPLPEGVTALYRRNYPVCTVRVLKATTEPTPAEAAAAAAAAEAAASTPAKDEKVAAAPEKPAKKG